MDAMIPRLFALQDSSNIFEAIIAGLYRAILHPGDLAVDGGANRGMHSFPLAELVGATGQVLAFEPIPALAESLRQEAARQGLSQIRVLQQALAERDDTAPFHWIRNADGYSGLRPRPYPLPPDEQMLQVETVALDRLLDGSLLPWRFCKLDLEGGEFRALQGAVRALARSRPVIVFENARAGSADAYGYGAAEYFGFFSGLDYRLYDLFGRHFGPAEWDSPGLPWYFIGVGEESEDQRLLERQLPAIIAALLARAG